MIKFFTRNKILNPLAEQTKSIYSKRSPFHFSWNQSVMTQIQLQSKYQFQFCSKKSPDSQKSSWFNGIQKNFQNTKKKVFTKVFKRFWGFFLLGNPSFKTQLVKIHTDKLKQIDVALEQKDKVEDIFEKMKEFKKYQHLTQYYPYSIDEEILLETVNCANKDILRTIFYCENAMKYYGLQSEDEAEKQAQKGLDILNEYNVEDHKESSDDQIYLIQILVKSVVPNFINPGVRLSSFINKSAFNIQKKFCYQLVRIMKGETPEFQRLYIQCVWKYIQNATNQECVHEIESELITFDQYFKINRSVSNENIIYHKNFGLICSLWVSQIGQKERGLELLEDSKLHLEYLKLNYKDSKQLLDFYSLLLKMTQELIKVLHHSHNHKEEALTELFSQIEAEKKILDQLQKSN